ncbi:hypothetical protein GCM10017708_05580 [Arthrobacter citreus]
MQVPVVFAEAGRLVPMIGAGGFPGPGIQGFHFSRQSSQGMPQQRRSDALTLARGVHRQRIYGCGTAVYLHINQSGDLAVSFGDEGQAGVGELSFGYLHVVVVITVEKAEKTA